MHQIQTTQSLYSTLSGVRIRIAAILLTIASISFSLGLIFFPFRFRIPLVARPMPPIYQDYTDLIVYLPDLMLVATLTAWGLNLFLLRKKPEFKPLALTCAILSMIVLIILGTIFSRDWELSAYYLLRTLGLFGLYLFLINEIRSLKQVALAIALGLYIQSAIALGQIWQQSSIGLQILGELKLDPAVSGVSIIFANGVRALRAYGLTDHPNLLGGCLALGLLLFQGWLIQDPGRSPSDRKIWLVQVPGFAVYALAFLALFFTYSRAAWLAFGIGEILISLLLWRTGQRDRLMASLSVLAVSMLLAAPFSLQNLAFFGARVNYQGSFNTDFFERRSLSERQALNQAGNIILTENAITGIGPGVFPQALQELEPDFPFDFQPPHLVPLLAATETGLFGGLAYSILLLIPWASLWINRHSLRITPSLLGVSAALLGVTVIGLFDYYPWLLTPGRYWLWTIWGIWGGIFLHSFDSRKNA